ncbi:MAG: hypothetical protein JNM17_13075 [Archangium sp.]|nr:hypothetical protein [Archangium sp.]
MNFALAMILTAAPDATLLDQLSDQTLAMETFWNKAACQLDVSADEKDGAGKVTKTVKTSLRVSRDGTHVTRKLLSHEENGKDLTEAKRTEIEGKEGTKTAKSPFHPTVRATYKFELVKPDRIAFEPLGARTEDNLIGEASIDPQNGRVLALTMRPGKFPMFVQELEIHVEFAANTPSGKGMSLLTVNGLAGALFFKKRFSVVTAFSDYAALP